MQYGYTPDTAVILLLAQTSAIRYRLDMLQTRKLFYFLFKFNYPLHFQMASISPSTYQQSPNGIYKLIPDKILSHLQMESINPSSYPPSFQMASVSPFTTSHCWYYTMWVQISGHSSVQSSSTFESRMAKLANLNPQAQEDWTGATVGPQNFPSHIIQIYVKHHLNLLKSTQGLHSPNIS